MMISLGVGSYGAWDVSVRIEPDWSRSGSTYIVARHFSARADAETVSGDVILSTKKRKKERKEN